jgi:kinesin family protein 18/19
MHAQETEHFICFHSEIIPCFGLQVVVVLDPDVSKEYLDRVQGRSKEKKYAYDVAFGAEATNEVLTL